MCVRAAWIVQSQSGCFSSSTRVTMCECVFCFLFFFSSHFFSILNIDCESNANGICSVPRVLRAFDLYGAHLGITKIELNGSCLQRKYISLSLVTPAIHFLKCFDSQRIEMRHQTANTIQNDARAAKRISVNWAKMLALQVALFPINVARRYLDA